MDVRSQYIIEEDDGTTGLRLDTVRTTKDGGVEYWVDVLFVDKGGIGGGVPAAKGMGGFSVADLRHLAESFAAAADDLEALQAGAELDDGVPEAPEQVQQTAGPKAKGKSVTRLLVEDKALTQRVANAMSGAVTEMGFSTRDVESWPGTYNLATFMLSKFDGARDEGRTLLAGEMKDIVKSTMTHYLRCQGFVAGDHDKWAGTGPLVEAAWPLVEREL